MLSDQNAQRALDQVPLVPPLTRNGYNRTARTEADIRAIHGHSAANLVQQFRTCGEDDPGGRTTEALVHFIRLHLARSDRRTAEALFNCLIERCQRRLRGAIRGVSEDARADIQATILEDMVRLLLAEDDGADFLECRFWLYLKRRMVSARFAWLRAHFRSPLVEDLGPDTGGPGLDDRQVSNDLSPEDMAVLADALDRLPVHLRELMVLRHYAGWKVGDETGTAGATGEPTLTDRYGITPRAIRKRLAKAAAILNEDQKDAR